VPHIYHVMPAEEDLYALFRAGATLVRRDVSAGIAMSDREPLRKGRKWSVNRIAKHDVEVRESQDFERYMAVAKEHLQEKHGVEPTHTAAEMALLAGRFPDSIKLFAAYQKAEMLGGVIMYLSPRVAHVQYIASTPQGRAIGAVEGVINLLLNETYAAVPYFDFGISTEEQGRYLNAGLAAFKEGFGARAVVYDTYAVEIPAVGS
jgi:Acetyltransferase (GNAT) domain